MDCACSRPKWLRLAPEGHRRAAETKAREIEPSTVEINLELDISTARNAARRMCEQAGAAFAIQKVTTIVSELARNIVSYGQGARSS